MLSIPWDDELSDHPAGWDFDALIGVPDVRTVHVIDFEEIAEEGSHDDRDVV